MVSLVTTCANRLQVDRRFKKIQAGGNAAVETPPSRLMMNGWWCALYGKWAGKGFQANVRFPPSCRIDTFPPRNRKTGLPAYEDHIKFL
jgi:hypothetical protein